MVPAKLASIWRSALHEFTAKLSRGVRTDETQCRSFCHVDVVSNQGTAASNKACTQSASAVAGEDRTSNVHDSCQSVDRPLVSKPCSPSQPHQLYHQVTSSLPCSRQISDLQLAGSISQSPRVSVSRRTSFSPTSASTIPNVVLGRLLGAGTYGTVYQGTWRDKAVAIKTVQLNLHDQASSFIHTSACKEADLAVQLRHPNIVTTYQCLRRSSKGGSWEQRLVQELCDCDLSALMSKGVFKPGFLLADGSRITRELQLECIVQVAQDVASGLAHMSSQDVLHGDVQPHNLLVKLNPQALPLGALVKVADFGLSHRLEGGEDEVQGVEHGTQFYAAPEVCHKGRLCVASDVYSFAVVLWEMLTAQTPFTTDPATGKLTWRSNFPVLPDDSGIPPELRDLVYSCLALEPMKRPGWGAILRQLQAVRAICVRLQEGREKEKQVQQNKELQKQKEKEHLSEQWELLPTSAKGGKGRHSCGAVPAVADDDVGGSMERLHQVRAEDVALRFSGRALVATSGGTKSPAAHSSALVQRHAAGV